MSTCKILAIANQKGGVGKTATTVNLGAALVKSGKRVLALDLDPQGNMTMSLGYKQPDELEVTISHLLKEEINQRSRNGNSELIEKRDYILSRDGLDFIPSSIDLAGMENILINTMSRESVLKDFLKNFVDDYEYIVIDTPPSLNILTVNALNACTGVLIPVQAQYLSLKGAELLFQTIAMVKKNLNPTLEITGVLITMLDKRTNFQKEIVTEVTKTYGDYIRIFESKIPVSVKVTETQALGKSIFLHDPKGKIAEGYSNLAKELLENE